MHRALAALTLLVVAPAIGCGTTRQGRGTEDPVDAAAPRPDLTAAEEPADLAVLPPDLVSVDLTPVPLLGCASISDCLNKCGGNLGCAARCPAIGTPHARDLLGQLVLCVFGDPNTGAQGACTSFGGGICDQKAAAFDKAACDQCALDAQENACFDALLACVKDCQFDNECVLDPNARCIDHECTLP